MRHFKGIGHTRCRKGGPREHHVVGPRVHDAEAARRVAEDQPAVLAVLGGQVRQDAEALVGHLEVAGVSGFAVHADDVEDRPPELLEFLSERPGH
jgi:hypothetical protein